MRDFKLSTVCFDDRDPNVRQMTAFMGGLDLCDGRYDTPQHTLFHTLNTVHSEDYHQACCPEADPKFGGALLVP